MPPSQRQIGMVLHALADHPALKGAYAQIDDKFVQVAEWLHDYADLMEAQRTDGGVPDPRPRGVR